MRIKRAFLFPTAIALTVFFLPQVGHMYVVHSKDRDSDHYAMFRVESLEPGMRVTISWKLIPPPK